MKNVFEKSFRERGKAGDLRVKIGHHKIGACSEIGQNRIRGGWGVKKRLKSSDIIYVRSLMAWVPILQQYVYELCCVMYL